MRKKDDISLSCKSAVQIFERIFILLMLDLFIQSLFISAHRNIAARFQFGDQRNDFIEYTNVLKVMHSKLSPVL